MAQKSKNHGCFVILLSVTKKRQTYGADANYLRLHRRSDAPTLSENKDERDIES